MALRRLATRLSRAARLATPLALAALALPAHAQAPAWPTKPVRLVVGFPAGGASDVAARAVGQKLAERLGQPVVIENKAGAASNIASDMVAKSAPDGYTVLLGTISLSINPSLYPKLAYDPLTDLAPVTQLSTSPFLLVANPATPWKTLPELLAAAKAAPGTLHYASAGNGSGAHLFMEHFAASAGIQLAHVPYKGAAPAMNDVLGGSVPLAFDNIITTLPLARAGKLRAYAVSTKVRSAAAPDIPALHELGVKDFDATAWFGLFVPAKTPPEIVKRLQDDTIEALKDPGVRERLLAVGSEPVGSTATEFGRFYRAEVEKWGKVVRAARVKLD